VGTFVATGWPGEGWGDVATTVSTVWGTGVKLYWATLVAIFVCMFSSCLTWASRAAILEVSPSWVAAVSPAMHSHSTAAVRVCLVVSEYARSFSSRSGLNLSRILQ
jgi:hypothetical protein